MLFTEVTTRPAGTTLLLPGQTHRTPLLTGL
jgi:hypothetical protein